MVQQDSLSPYTALVDVFLPCHSWTAEIWCKTDNMSATCTKPNFLKPYCLQFLRNVFLFQFCYNCGYEFFNLLPFTSTRSDSSSGSVWDCILTLWVALFFVNYYLYIKYIRSMRNICLDTYQGASVIMLRIFYWNLCIMAILGFAHYGSFYYGSSP